MRLFRILRMVLGLVFTRRELWVVVEAGDTEDAIYAARNACPHPGALSGIMVNLLPGYRNQWRVEYIYDGKGQK